MIKLSHNAAIGWIAKDTETGEEATATFDEGKEVALGRLHDAHNKKAATKVKKRAKAKAKQKDEAED